MWNTLIENFIIIGKYEVTRTTMMNNNNITMAVMIKYRSTKLIY